MFLKDANTYFLFFFSFLFLSYFISGQDVKSSLTFVIDDTGSMSDDIDQVKKGADAIFDTVWSSNASQIDNFVLVTFNDPDVKLLTITEDRLEFKHALESIRVHGGGDCPEQAMSGIELAIEKSLPGSYIYVFTDASAKDHDKIERVKNLSHKSQCQVVFVLTGLCGSEADTDYQVYHTLAEATSGQVFHLKKDSVKKILKYVEETVTSRKTVLASKKFPKGYGNKFNITVDPAIKDIILSVAGKDPKVDLTGPDGNKTDTKEIVRTPDIAVVKVSDPKPGTHIADVGSKSDTTAVVTGSTTIDFQYGFSDFKATSLNDTSIRPLPDENLYLSIKLKTDGGDVHLETIQILDIDENVKLTMPLELYNEKEKFYITEPFKVPNILFKIAINGYDVKTKAPIKRISLTPIEHQKPSLEKSENKAPIVNIEGGYDKDADYGEPLQLKCKVIGFPQPNILWTDVSGGTLSSKVSIIEFPDKFIAIHEITNVNTNSTYKCTASNSLGENSKKVEVKAKLVNKAPVVNSELESPIIAEYDEPLQIKCKVKAYPRPTIVWVDQGLERVLHASDSQIEYPYEYMSVVNIPKINRNTTYQCKATNEYGANSVEIKVETKKKTFFNVVKFPTDTTIEYEKEGYVYCQIDAFPPAEVVWYRNGTEISNEIADFEISPDKYILHIKNMQPNYQGTFLCEARNEQERKLFRFKVAISGLERPELDKNLGSVKVNRGSDVTITCRVVRGIPAPTITWLFQNRISHDFIEMKEYNGTEQIRILQADSTEAGIYRCIARNEVGYDFHDMTLVVNYAPIIKSSAEKIKARDGDRVILPCVVDGFPVPIVKWIKNDTVLSSEMKTYKQKVYSKSFVATVRDSGDYICEAKNIFGVARQLIRLDVNVPVKIEPPKRSVIEVMVGDDLVLPCDADGHPTPDIKWVFNSKDPHIKSKVWSVSTKPGSLHQRRIQVDGDGFYTCIASNIGGSTNITYEVKVYAPPKIINVHPEKIYKAVTGDLVLRIPCQAIGNPIPTIVWIRGGLNVPAGSEWYDIENDGTLNIKNIDKDSKGSYVCQATNKFGEDKEMYEVDVSSYPETGSPTSTVLIEEGKSSPINCDIPHERTDMIRWFKNEKFIASGELFVEKATLSDSGIYTCRVSNFVSSRNGNTKVNVGAKPKFLYEAETNINFEEGALAVLDCASIGKPTPTVTWWHDGIKINVTNMENYFDMTLSHLGNYFCVVSNIFGKITRRFEIISNDCILDIRKDFSMDSPLMLSPYLHWPDFVNIDGFMRIPSYENILLSCPKGFRDLPRTEVIATCERRTEFLVEGKIRNYSELECKDDSKPLMKRTGRQCLPGNTELIEVGYEMRGRVLTIYEVCLDRVKNIPLYAKHKMQQAMANIIPTNEPDWFGDDIVPFHFEDLYNCKLQIDIISSFLSKWFHKEDQCCFGKRQLVNPRDVLPGLPQRATYSYLNLVPQWSVCNTENWDDMEERVRSLTKSAGHEMLVWTGVYQQLQLANTALSVKDIYVSDKYSQLQPVPRYLWKVVQDPATKASLAIIQINIPDLDKTEARRHILCRDICNEIEWMKNTEWHNLTKGYTYCCSIKEFEVAFGYGTLIDRGDGEILREVPVLSVPYHSLILS